MKIVLSLVILLVLSACTVVGGLATPPNPNETITAFFAHVNAGEFNEADQLLSDTPPISLKEIEADHSGIFDHLDYQFVSETLEDNRAYLRVNVSALDFTRLMETVISEALFWVFVEMTEEELYALVNELLIEKMSAENAPVVTNEVTIVLELRNNAWQIVPDDALFDGVTGGVLSFAEYVAGW